MHDDVDTFERGLRRPSVHTYQVMAYMIISDGKAPELLKQGLQIMTPDQVPCILCSLVSEPAMFVPEN